jgi:hypothetical protein
MNNVKKKSGCNVSADDEISIWLSTIDESKDRRGKPISGQVVVNHHVVN